MKKILLVAGSPKHQIRMRSGRHKIPTCAKAFDWLHNLFLHPDYIELIRIYALCKPELWYAYESMGITGLREQVLLEEASKKVLKLWRTKRPQLFGKDRPKDINFADNGGIESCRT